uniref:Tumor protein p53-inducible nuclear protein 2 n=1 Tax=Denticeps clupeoides TaxID=299321 RepID=A0AAY4CZ57_9TELE
MFQRLTNLLFWKTDEISLDQTVLKARSADKEDEGWLVVSPTEWELSPEPSCLEDALTPHTSQTLDDSVVSLMNNSSLCGSEMTVSHGPASRPRRRLASQTGAQAKVSHVARVQRAQAWACRRRLGKKCIQRQNHAHQTFPRHASRTRPTFLHQPGHRSFSH